MDKPPFSEHGTGKRCSKVCKCIEIGPCAYKNVRRDAGSSKNLIRPSASLSPRRGIIRHDEQKIVVAVRVIIPTRGRSKEVDLLWLIRRNELSYQSGKSRVLCCPFLIGGVP